MGWSELWRPGDWTVLDEPRRLRLALEAAGSRRGLSPDAVGEVQGGVEVSTVVRGETVSDFLFYLGLHLSGDAGSENGYLLLARPPHATDPNHLRIGKYQDGMFTTLASASLPFELDADTWYRMRFRREGSAPAGQAVARRGRRGTRRLAGERERFRLRRWPGGRAALRVRNGPLG